MAFAMSLDLGPDTRMIPTPPRPGGVAMATMVSVLSCPNSISLSVYFAFNCIDGG